MPYKSIEGAKEAGFPTKAEEISLTLAQINKLADIYDSVKAAGTAKNPMAVAWTQWKKLFKKVGDKWVTIEKDTYNLPETVDLKGIEIFSAKYRPKGHKYTDEQLEKIVDGFYETEDELKPYLKFGHDDKQKLVQTSGMPALGWVKNLRKVGKKLIADFIKVPKKIYELIKAGAYRRISAEILWNCTVKNKKYE